MQFAGPRVEQFPLTSFASRLKRASQNLRLPRKQCLYVFCDELRLLITCRKLTVCLFLFSSHLGMLIRVLPRYYPHNKIIPGRFIQGCGC
ncbi:hypothetical protein BJX65DRAFT_279696 [Aspergillus insuetus]